MLQGNKRNNKMKSIKFLFIFLVFLVFAVNTVDAYAGLMGGEFVVRAIDMWGPDKPEYMPSVISVVAFDNGTNIEVWTFEDNGNKLLVYNGTMNEDEVIDFYDRGCLLGDTTPRNHTTCISGTLLNPNDCSCNSTTYLNTAPTKIFGKFVHIMLTGTNTTKRGYVFVVEGGYASTTDEFYKYGGYGGTLRTPPGRSGSFLDKNFVVHYPWRYTDGAHYPIIGIFYWHNDTTNVTITPIGLNGSVLPSDVNGRSQYTCTLIGNGDPRYPAYCTFKLYASPWGRAPVSYRIDASDDVFLMQYNGHIDTMQWNSALDSGILSGQVILSAGNYEGGGILFNSENYTVDVSVFYVNNYGGSGSNTYEANSVNGGSVTAGSVFGNLVPVGNLTIPAHNSKMYISSLNPSGGQIVLIMVNGSGSIDAITGIGRDKSSSGQSHLARPWDHIYTRVPPKVRSDNETWSEFGFGTLDRSSPSEFVHWQTAVSWDIYPLACYPLETNSTKINVNRSGTVCFDSGVTDASHPLNLQGYNST
ncbi:MAG: hypothetical protein BWK75_06755, partial [Candidatus Altiarchaeales archaeon A3]